MNQQDWTQRLSEQLANHEIPAPDHLWADIEAALPPAAPHPTRFVALRRWSVAAAVALMAVGGGYLLWPDGHAVQESAIAMMQPSTMVEEMKEATTDLAAKPYDENLPVAVRHAKRQQAKSGLPVAKPQEAMTEPSQPPIVEPQQSAGKPQQPAEERQQPAEERRHQAIEQSQQPPIVTKSHARSWSLQLYAANGTNEQMNRNNVQMSSEMAAKFTAAARSMEPIYLTDYEERQHHHRPLSLGLTVSYPLGQRLSLTTGAVWTRVNSEFTTVMRTNIVQKEQTLHYVGLPLGLSYRPWDNHRLSVYVAANAQADWNVAANQHTEGIRQPMERDRCQLSVSASMGVSYTIVPHVGLYAEPGIRHYFDNGSHVDNFFKHTPTSASVQLGLRIEVK